MNVVGRVRALWRYPVKSMIGEPLERAPFGPDGIPGDRAFAVVDATTGRVLSAKAVEPLLHLRAVARPGGPVIRFPDGRALYATDAADEVSAMLGRSVRIERWGGTDERRVIQKENDETFLGRAGGFFDSGAVHILGTATLAGLAALYEGAFDERRFRPNIVVDATGSEQEWIGGILEIGDTALAATQPCSRCVVTTAAQEELPKDRGILATVARRADNVVGIYAAVRAPGAISVGDEVVLTRP